MLWPPDGKNRLIRKYLMQGKIKGRRQRGRQKMKLLGGITDLMNMSLSNVREVVMDRETWHDAPHDIWLRDWTELMYRGHQGAGRSLWGPVKPVALVGAVKDLETRGGFPSSGAGPWIQSKEHQILNVLPNIVFLKNKKTVFFRSENFDWVYSLDFTEGCEGIWSGLSLQKLGDQLLEGQAYDRHSALDGKQIQRKTCPF